MRPHARALVFALAPVAACVGPSVDPGAPAEHDEALACAAAGEPLASRPARADLTRSEPLIVPRATWVPTWVPPSSQRASTGQPVTIYLNHVGATLSGNYDDAAHDASSVVAGAGKASATIGPYPGSDAEWQQVVACVADEFARFHVVITDQRPTTSDYYMAMFGSDASVLGFPAGVGGVAPLDAYQCNNVPSAVVFIFSGSPYLGANPQLNCEIAAQEISHAFSLDHELLASDPMTYLSYAGHKTFQDTDAQCGEYQARPCVCNRPSQNSVQLLLQHMGAASGSPNPNPGPTSGDTTPPTVSLVSPATGSSQPAPLTIVVDAHDDTAVESVTLRYADANGSRTVRCGDGQLPCAQAGSTYTFTVADARGKAIFSIAATDGAGHVATTETRSVTIDAGGGGQGPGPSGGGGPTQPGDAPYVTLNVDCAAFDSARAVVPRATVVPSGSHTIASVTLLWTDAAGLATRVPMCRGAGASWSVTMKLAASDGARTVAVEASDEAGHTTTSAPVQFSVGE